MIYKQNLPIAQIIRGLTEFDGTQVAPQPTNPPNGGQPNNPPPVAGVSRDEMVQAIEKARKEEKQKLYKQIKAEEEKRKELEDRLKAIEADRTTHDRSKLGDAERLQAQIQDLQKQVEASNTQLAETFRKAEDDRRAYELSIYREQVIRDYASQGVPLMADLVKGSTKEEIDQNALVARAEYAHWQQHFFGQFQTMYQPQPVPQPGAQPPAPQPGQPGHATHVMTQGQQPVPQMGPAVTNPAPNPGEGGMDFNQISQVTSMDAIRSGEYGKNREAILARLRQGVSPSPGMALPMRPMNPAVQQPAPPAPGPQFASMPYQPQPGGVMQPMGLPTPPVMNPSMPQGGYMGMPTVGYPQQGGQPDARAMAAEAAHRALSNPQLAVQQAGTIGRPATHPEYQFQNPGATGAQVPSPQQLVAPHPQIRTNV